MHVAAYFQAKILDNTRDCVVLVDPVMNVIGWNRRVEQLTGILAESIIERRWTPEMVELRDFEDRLVDQRRFTPSGRGNLPTGGRSLQFRQEPRRPPHGRVTYDARS